MMWPITATLLEKIPPFGYIPVKNYKARLVKFGDAGEEIYYLKGIKKYRIGYGKKIGRNRIAWAKGDDGYWYNVTFGDMDKRLQQVGIVPVERDMRFATAALRKGIENRYNDKTFFEKWGVPISIGMLILGMLVQGAVMWFLLDKMGDTSTISLETSKVNKATMELANQVLSNIASLQNGGTGLQSALWLPFGSTYS